MNPHIKVVIIGVRDMQRAIRFWRDVMKFPLKFEASVYSELDTTGAVLALEKRSEMYANGPVFTIESENIQNDVAELKTKDVQFFREIREEDFGFVALPQDSEGNIFELVQYKKPDSL